MATTRMVRFIPAASLLVILGACAVQSNGDDATSSQSAAMENEPRCDICCLKGGTWDKDHWLCCIPLKNGSSICTNAPETIKFELAPTRPPPTTASTVVTYVSP